MIGSEQYEFTQSLLDNSDVLTEDNFYVLLNVAKNRREWSGPSCFT